MFEEVLVTLCTPYYKYRSINSQHRAAGAWKFVLRVPGLESTLNAPAWHGQNVGQTLSEPFAHVKIFCDKSVSYRQ
jgi:hypothetical protein